jgi:heat shock protein HspQ
VGPKAWLFKCGLAVLLVSDRLQNMALSNIHFLAKFHIGMAVRHRVYGFRGIVFDVDPEFDNTDQWYDSIPEDVRPKKEQPFYHLFAETLDKAPYIAYVSEQNLVPDEDTNPIQHPDLGKYFEIQKDGSLSMRSKMN